MSEFVIRARRVVTSDGCAPASVLVRDGVVASVGEFEDVGVGVEVVEVGSESVLMPGLVDSHVHVNEPGRTDWEGFETATRAAARGGVTTIVDMPLNSLPPTTTREHLRAKLDAAEGKCAVDVGFWGGLVPGNMDALAEMFKEGVAGFKCFLIHSGVEEFPNVSEEDLRASMPELARLGATLIAHAEMPGPVERAGAKLGEGVEDPRRYETFLRSRPRAAEDEAIDLLVRLCRETGARTHVVHHSSSDSLALIARAREEGLPLTAETCPHYLRFASEEIADGATEFKCCPPVRERENRERLWGALADGTLSMIVSDHSPCPPALKLREEGDFLRAWGGISSLQLRLPVVWTEARARGFDFPTLARWLCEAPAQLAGLDARKGAIAEGRDADFVVWNPEESFKVEPSAIEHRHKLTPYTGETLSGTVEATYLRGALVYERGRGLDVCKAGRLIKRGGGEWISRSL
ncbi:MAG TPA: allantoinase AllB [Pyrinomonadaceae bacterium]|nr:allantoinase AllB [Pyrinomonadaceae bacterium]